MSSLALIALTILPSLLLPYPVSTALVNQTIDDKYGDSVTGTLPVYGPDESYWHEGSSCSVCHITPLVDTTQPFDRTWHDGTYNPGGPDMTITFSFTGTAVYVYNIVPNTVEFTVTFANITFTLDGSPVGTYVHDPDPTSVLLYRQVVYKNTSLDNRQHTMEMRSSGMNASLILFDYVIYTAEQATSSSGTSSSSTSSASSSATSAPSSSSPHSHSTPVGAIAGGIVGGIAVLALLAIVGFFIQRRRNPKEPRPLSGSLEIKPFMDGGGPYASGVPYHDSESGGSVSAGGGSGYGGSASGSNAIPLLLANRDSSQSSRRQASVKRKMVPLSTHIQSSSSPGTPGSTPTRQHTSASPSAPASQHEAELTDRIRVLEDRMRGLAADSTAGSDRSWRATSRPASNDTGTGDEAVRTLQGELAALRSEVAGLNAELAEGRMRGGGELLPPYLESPHTSRPQS